MPYPRVLVATDLSDASASAARLAARMSAAGGSMRVLTVLAVPEPPLHLGAAAREELRAAAEARLEETRHTVALWAREAGLKNPEVHVRRGAVGTEIAREAVDAGAQLVAIGATGATRFERVLLGSTARSILRHVACDLLVARGVPDPPRLRRILVAADFYGPSKTAGRRAAELAAATGAEVGIVHVVDPALWAGVVREEREGGGLDRAWLEKTLGGLMNAYNKEVFAGKAKEHLAHGRAAAEVANAARAWEADLLVVGTHGASLVPRLLLGSVAEAIVEQAGCSVLVARLAA